MDVLFEDGSLRCWVQVKLQRRRQTRHPACGRRARIRRRFARGLSAVHSDAAACCRSGGTGSPCPQLGIRRAGRPSSRVGGHGDLTGAGSPLYAVGIPAFRFWMRGCSGMSYTSFQLAGILSTRAFRALASRTICTAGGDASIFGTHGVRRGAAASLFHAGVRVSLVTQALRHASARSDESCILESVKLTAVAVAPRMPLPAGPLALPQRLENGSKMLPVPQRGGWSYSLWELLSRWWPVGNPDGQRAGSAGRASPSHRNSAALL